MRAVAIGLSTAFLSFSPMPAPWSAVADNKSPGQATATCSSSSCLLDASAPSSTAGIAPVARHGGGSAPACQYVPDGGLTTADDGTKGYWYRLACGAGFDQGMLGGPALPLWAPAGQPVPAIPPQVVAQQAESHLVLPVPAVAMSPAAFQVVRVPTWLWVAGAAWRPVTATAQVPGTAVTATATPVSVVWDLGDGAAVTCRGAGTPYRPGVGDPAAVSPDCGHTYLVSSADQPDGVFTVTARVHWTVDWTGGGQQGVFPDLVSTTSRAVRVQEVQDLTVTPAR